MQPLTPALPTAQSLLSPMVSSAPLHPGPMLGMPGYPPIIVQNPGGGAGAPAYPPMGQPSGSAMGYFGPSGMAGGSLVGANPAMLPLPGAPGEAPRGPMTPGYFYPGAGSQHPGPYGPPPTPGSFIGGPIPGGGGGGRHRAGIGHRDMGLMSSHHRHHHDHRSRNSGHHYSPYISRSMAGQGVNNPETRGAGPPPVPTAQRGPTVYLGHLTPETDDTVVRLLLQECGRVLRWSRTIDPATKKLSSFGFCEFESPLGVTRAVRCLNGLVLDGQALVANCEDKVKEGLKQWRNDRKNKLQEENPAKSIQEIEQEVEKEEQRIAASTQRIANEWNVKTQALRQQAAAAAIETPPAAPGAHDEVAPPPPSHPGGDETRPTVPSGSSVGGGADPPPSSSASASATAPGKPQASASAASGPSAPQLSKRDVVLDALPGYVEVPAGMTLSAREAARVRQWNAALKESRAELRKRVQAWEQKEQYLIRERKRRQEETRMEVEKPCRLSSSQKKRLIDRDLRDLLYYLAPDGTVWEGELSSRRGEERNTWLEAERAWDLEDAEREKKELEDAEKRANGEASKSCAEGGSGTDEKTFTESRPFGTGSALTSSSGAAGATGGTTSTPSIYFNLSLTNPSASANAARGREEKPSPLQPPSTELNTGAEILNNVKIPTTSSSATTTLLTEPASSSVGVGSATPPTTVAQPTASKLCKLFVMGDEDDDDELNKSKLRLPKFETYTKPTSETTNADAAQRKRELVMQIASQIPQTTEDLFAFSIDWNLLKANNIFESKVNPWIGKKVVEFLGEEEPELTAFISTKVSLHPVPHVFLEELKEFLDEDAKGFVAKLWKMLIFEVLRLRHQAPKQGA